MCFGFLYNFFSETFLILRRSEQDTIKKVHWSCQSLMKPEFSRQIFGKNAQLSNFMKIRPVGAELFHVDGQPDRHDEANNRFFCDFARRA
jgi:hypothetical protein